jgi:hypothetical protein
MRLQQVLRIHLPRFVVLFGSFTHLLCASAEQSPDVVQYLLDNAARIKLNIDAGNQNGATPLYISW